MKSGLGCKRSRGNTLEEWIAGKNEKLKKLMYRTRHRISDEDLLEGITTTATTFSEQPLHKRGVCTNCPLPILEIKRPTDGGLVLSVDVRIV
ncbi:hypothetical protein CAEBREN_23164 [Caenorhabditis brenneri]|uniref:Uncharacterized protein n=1 Tax=Caenorhabditis brenneri TaxID=135651 RepID=G0NX38_CAEBE|nr:hypothetical protein CAEBREN_23164 [Caenorhabditis brenneri]